ncbi:hypothetical protein COO60DRAFT_360789 [Scenedesmus sp. NREL 46B-D3]|nr:hypothetical protein COO60DRAFT_360789 [Scenedesmus sp. NREL 46B-D3]
MWQLSRQHQQQHQQQQLVRRGVVGGPRLCTCAWRPSPAATGGGQLQVVRRRQHRRRHCSRALQRQQRSPAAAGRHSKRTTQQLRASSRPHAAASAAWWVRTLRSAPAAAALPGQQQQQRQGWATQLATPWLAAATRAGSMPSTRWRLPRRPWRLPRPSLPCPWAAGRGSRASASARTPSWAAWPAAAWRAQAARQPSAAACRPAAAAATASMPATAAWLAMPPRCAAPPAVPLAALAAAAAAAAAAGGASSGDYRYSELIFRLRQFLPALRAADGCGPASEFESTWELIKSELLALVSTARLASMQAGRLEVLDAEVAQLQKVLVRVGQHIKSGAQQQQLRDLVGSFPSFARRQMLDSTSSSDGLTEAAPPCAAAAAAASPKPAAAAAGELAALLPPQPSASPKAAGWPSPGAQLLHNSGLSAATAATAQALLLAAGCWCCREDRVAWHAGGGRCHGAAQQQNR